LAVAQAKQKNPKYPVNLQGVAIGNGLVDPFTQAPSATAYAHDMALIGDDVYEQLLRVNTQCQSLISAKSWEKAAATCGSILYTILSSAGNVNPMRVDKRCAIQDCFNYSAITNYLNEDATRIALGIPDNVFWSACNYNSSFYFTAQDQMSSFAPTLTKFIHSLPAARVLIYYGDQDLVCPWSGGLDWTERMNWPGQEGFLHTPMASWMLNGAVAGQVKAYETLTFARVLLAGHMAPHDQPAAAFDLFTRFIQNRNFTS